MTERLADIAARIEGIGQLDAVVNAMRGIAAARLQQARGQLIAVDSYTAIIAGAIGQVTGPFPIGARSPGRTALVLFCAEQGFAGAFSEHVLDAADAEPRAAELFLIGSRGIAIAAQRGVTPSWSSAMPAYSDGIPKLADHIAEALYARIASGAIATLDTIFTRGAPAGHPDSAGGVARIRLFPLDLADVPPATNHGQPLSHLPPEQLLRELTAEYLHARLCNAGLHAFAAESAARMRKMESARHQIERQLTTLRAVQRRVRQEEITAEIIELAAGESAGRGEPAAPG